MASAKSAYKEERQRDEARFTVEATLTLELRAWKRAALGSAEERASWQRVRDMIGRLADRAYSAPRRARKSDHFEPRVVPRASSEVRDV